MCMHKRFLYYLCLLFLSLSLSLSLSHLYYIVSLSCDAKYFECTIVCVLVEFLVLERYSRVKYLSNYIVSECGLRDVGDALRLAFHHANLLLIRSCNVGHARSNAALIVSLVRNPIRFLM